MADTKTKQKEQNLRDFLYDVQKGKDQKDLQEGLLMKEKEERKNVLNLKIVVAVDISGSVSVAQYKSFMQQLDKIRGLSKVRVMETDTKVVAMYDYYKANQERVIKLSGGGGTDFHEAMDYSDRCKPDVIVFMTDGYDTGDLNQPETPVAWVLTKHGTCQYDWGTVVTRVDK